MSILVIGTRLLCLVVVVNRVVLVLGMLQMRCMHALAIESLRIMWCIVERVLILHGRILHQIRSNGMVRWRHVSAVGGVLCELRRWLSRFLMVRTYVVLRLLGRMLRILRRMLTNHCSMMWLHSAVLGVILLISALPIVFMDSGWRRLLTT